MTVKSYDAYWLDILIDDAGRKQHGPRRQSSGADEVEAAGLMKSNRTRSRAVAWEHFPKTLFALSRCRISKAKGSGDLLSRTQMHVGGRDEEIYDGGAVVSRGENLTCVAIGLTLAARRLI
jgi:hypothetical protein